MPYVQVTRPDKTNLTNSILEAHRLNSPYILEGKDDTVLKMLKTDVAGMEKGPVGQEMKTLSEGMYELSRYMLLQNKKEAINR